MSRVLFVVTSSENMGDLALCQEWINDLGRVHHTFGFVVHRDVAPYIDPADELFLYEYYIHVKDTILEACEAFAADALIFASNSFWNLPGHFGASFGEFILEPGDVEIPVMSFDPFEVEVRYQMHQSPDEVRFSGIPPWVWALRYMSIEPQTPNAVHFTLKPRAFSESEALREEMISRWGGDPQRKTIMFPVSQNRWAFIKEHYPRYYEHLAGIFEQLPPSVQVLALSPREVVEFSHLPQVVQLPLLKYQDFHDLVAAADLYLTDSYISCIFNAFMLATPAVVLHNTERSRPLAPGSFLEHDFFPFKVFPYGLTDACAQLEAAWGTAGCYHQLEVLDTATVVEGLMEMLTEGPVYQKVVQQMRVWQDAHKAVYTPTEAMQAIMSGHPRPEQAAVMPSRN